MIRLVIFTSIVVVAVPPVSAQAPPTAVYATPQAPALASASPLPTLKADLADVPPPPPRPVEAARLAEARRSVARPAALPRQASSTRDYASAARRDPLAGQGRFANPGGVGRVSEYYTAFTPISQSNDHPPAVVRFDKGAGPDRGEQIAAFRAGQMRTRNIQNNINAYGRPYGAYGAGLGFGFGLATGGLYGGGFR